MYAKCTQTITNYVLIVDKLLVVTRHQSIICLDQFAAWKLRHAIKNICRALCIGSPFSSFGGGCGMVTFTGTHQDVDALGCFWEFFWFIAAS